MGFSIWLGGSCHLHARSFFAWYSINFSRVSSTMFAGNLNSIRFKFTNRKRTDNFIFELHLHMAGGSEQSTNGKHFNDSLELFLYLLLFYMAPQSRYSFLSVKIYRLGYKCDNFASGKFLRKVICRIGIQYLAFSIEWFSFYKWNAIHIPTFRGQRTGSISMPKFMYENGINKCTKTSQLTVNIEHVMTQ